MLGLESKGMRASFHKKGKERAKNVKKGKYLKIWVKVYDIRKYFEKDQVIACDYCTL